jgi:alcohol dehydrogenase YqhD (iron-dependent ADH family)
VLISDPAVCRGSAPRRTAVVGLQFFAALLERYAGNGAPPTPPEADLALEEAMRRLVDALPRAIAASDDAGPRLDLALATARAAEGMAAAGVGPTPIELAVMRLPRGSADVAVLRAAVLPALMEACGDAPAALSSQRVARFGRQVLGIREADDGRAASWAAGGIRQWVRNLGFATHLPAGALSTGSDPTLRSLFGRPEDRPARPD